MQASRGNAEVLGEFIGGAALRNIPAAAIDAARLCLADWIAVAIGAASEDAGRVVRKTAAGWDASGQSTMIFGRRTAAPMAALANGTLAHCLDFDDTFIPAVTHTSAPVWAAVLALGEARSSDEMAMLRAFITGFEVAARVGRGLGQGVTARGLHSTGIFGRIGAAAGAAALLGLDAKSAVNALAAAATQAGGLTASFGTMAKPFHAGKAAMDGVLSAELAAGGFVAAPAVLEPGGLDKAFVQDGSISIAKMVFEDWEILSNSFKPYAACHLVHPAVDAARSAGIDPARIRRARARVSPLAMQITGGASGHPATPLAAKFDLRYCIALGLHGYTAAAGDFREPWVADKSLVATAQKIDAEIDPGYGFATARLTLDLDDGGSRVIDVATAKGHPGNPMRWDDMWEKFDGLVRPELGDCTPALFDLIRTFGNGTSLTAVRDILASLETREKPARH